MIQHGIGSLKEENDQAELWRVGETEDTGDATRKLKIGLADDPDAQLRVFIVDEAAGVLRDIQEDQNAQLGVFRSSDMHVIMYSCKRGKEGKGGLHIVYTWEGDQAPLSARTVAGLRVQTLKDDLKFEGAQHQIYVQQFSEPPLLVAIFASR